MKTWNYHTYKGRRFFRLNHAELSKDKFFLSYYRILHTAYLEGVLPCISSVNKMFEESFGLELKAWSLAYITNTEPCFVNDTVVETLNQSGKFTSLEYLKQMLIEIGFDVYLMQTIESNKKPDRKAFYRWLPMKRGHCLKKTVKNFWKERLPKEKFLTGLYYQLEAYKKGILTTYRKLLVENDSLVLSVPEKENILAYIDTDLAVQFISEEENEAENEAEETEAVSEVVGFSGKEETEIQQEMQQEMQAESQAQIKSEEQKFIQPKIMQQPIVKPTMGQQPVLSEQKIQSGIVQKRKTMPAPECRGFREKNNKMTHKKAVTCAVCVAAAGALLVPLVAYTVIKHRA